MSALSAAGGRAPSERALVFLIGAVQFVNVLDFMMVMPLGPDFARGLSIAPSQLGTLGASYTAAAALAGLAGASFLDRFERRAALAVAMGGLVLATAAGGLASGLPSLLAARVAAGLFGGPATSLSLAIVADLVPVERRGRALGGVMGAVSVAQVAGVPLALAMAQHGGWRAPFFGVAAAGLVVVAVALFYLPPVRGHLAGARAAGPLRVLLSQRVVQLSYLTTATVMAAGFVLLPNISAWLQQNLGYPRERLWLVYLLGGSVGFVTLRGAGHAVDRFGPWRVGAAGCALLATVVGVGFVRGPSPLPIPAFFMLFMLGLATRNVAHSTLASRVPPAAERARFMSLHSAVQHLASAAGALLSSRLLDDLPDGTLGGVERMALVSVGLTLLAPLLMRALERRVREREARALAAPRPAPVP